MTPTPIDDLFDYDPETGWFTNKHSRGPAVKGARAGSDTGHGYRRIIISRVKHYEHHLAWLWVHGVYPDEIDHINGIRDDNRIANLRLCTRTQNNYNSDRPTGQSGLKGAYLDKRNLQWYSHIQLGGQCKFLGNFDSPEEAHAAYMAAYEAIAGEFAYLKPPLERTI